MFLKLPIHRKTTSPSQNCYIIGYKPIKYKGHFFSPSTDYSYFSEDTMIRSLKILDIRVLKKITSGHKF